jgi:hypothetical protein
MQETVVDGVVYTTGPRILEDGTNLDADFSGGHPVVQRRQISDPVSDGSLGEPGYEPGQKNKDGSVL